MSFFGSLYQALILDAGLSETDDRAKSRGYYPIFSDFVESGNKRTTEVNRTALISWWILPFLRTAVLGNFTVDNKM